MNLKEDRTAAEDYLPLSVRNAGQIRKNMKPPHLWLSFASIIFLIAAAIIVAYKAGLSHCQP
jgi:hypothetical protein